MTKYITEVCKLGQQHECCRYLVMGGNGFECAKLTSLKEQLDMRVNLNRMNAQGDNCIGLTQDELDNKL